MEAELNYGLKRFFTRLVLQIASDSWFVNYRLRVFLYRLVGIDIGKNCFIGRNVYFDELNLKGIHIGNHVILTMGTTLLSHFLNSKQGCFELGEVFIEDDAFIGLNTLITKPVRIGKKSVIGAGSVVTKDIPENVVAAGNPCRIIKHRELGGGNI